MHMCVIPVGLLVMVPVLLRSGQYLQVVVWLQVWKPPSFRLVPLLDVVSLCVFVSLVAALGTVSDGLGCTNSDIDVCYRIQGAMTGGIIGASGGSLSLMLTVALQRRSHRFLGCM